MTRKKFYQKQHQIKKKKQACKLYTEVPKIHHHNLSTTQFKATTSIVTGGFQLWYYDLVNQGVIIKTMCTK